MRYFLYSAAALLFVSLPVTPWLDVSLSFKTNKIEHILQVQRKQFELRAELQHLHNLHILGF